MAKSVAPIHTMPVSIISIFPGQNYNTLWKVCVMCNSWIFWIMPCVARFLILFHPPLPNVSCVSNILPRLMKLALLCKVLLCRLVWLTDFLDNLSPKGNNSYKRHQILKKYRILCTSVALFLVKYKKLANITASLYFVEKWVTFEQDMALIKSIISDITIVLD